MTDYSPTEQDLRYLQIAVDLALRGAGSVEPNPMVGCVVLNHGELSGLGWHQAFGQPHAEVNALADAGPDLGNSTVYITLEPCCHTGKTPPCTELLISRRPGRIVVGCIDPNPAVSGQGIQQLRNAGIQVDVANSFAEGHELIRPFAKMQIAKRPWITGKWATSLDGRTATSQGESKWITGSAARANAHQTRGRMDGIMTGINTVLADDPMLTARLTGPRIAIRIVLDSTCRMPADSQLAQSAGEIPVLVVCGPTHQQSNRNTLESLGVRFLVCQSDNRQERLEQLLNELGRWQLTNILVESGGELLGALEDIGELDEVHSYVAPALIGGDPRFVPVRNSSTRSLAEKTAMKFHRIEQLGDDVLLVARRVTGSDGY